MLLDEIPLMEAMVRAPDPARAARYRRFSGPVERSHRPIRRAAPTVPHAAMGVALTLPHWRISLPAALMRRLRRQRGPATATAPCPAGC